MRILGDLTIKTSSFFLKIENILGFRITSIKHFECELISSNRRLSQFTAISHINFYCFYCSSTSFTPLQPNIIILQKLLYNNSRNKLFAKRMIMSLRIRPLFLDDNAFQNNTHNIESFLAFLYQNK